MAEYATSLSCIKLQMQRNFPQQRVFIRGDSHLQAPRRKCSYRSSKVSWFIASRVCKLGAARASALTVNPCCRMTSLRCSCLGSVMNTGIVIASEWIPIVDQVLLITSIFLTYIAGVIPVQDSNSTFQKNIADDSVVPESPTSPGSANKNSDHVNLKHAWDVVRGKLLDSLDALEHGRNFGNGVLKYEQPRAKRTLSLHAISDGPKIRLLWASFQQLEQEVNNIIGASDIANMDDWLKVYSKIIQNSCKPICIAWLEKEHCLENSNKALVFLMIEKLDGDNTILRNIIRAGKEVLYAELLYFLRFGALRTSCCFDHSLFTLHGDSILEDMVITLADAIASVYLELISVDGNFSDEMNSIGSVICNLSTRALQKLRNEVALSQWLYQNVEAVVSMYEDRFDLCTLKCELREGKNNDNNENASWWKKLTVRKSDCVSPSLRYAVMSDISMPVKRTKELRALTGWRYYFSLFLEFSDISMPIVRVIFDKVSNAISFFLVCLIGRSLGLIYTGIRQSLRWK